MDNSEFLSKTATGEDTTITESIESREQSQKSGHDYRLVVKNASQGIVIAQENAIRYTNPKISEYSGYTREELASRPFIELIHPDDREMVIDRHRDVLLGKKPLGHLKHRIIDKAGRTKWIEVTGVPFTWEEKASTLLFISDITEQKEIEDRLRKSETSYQDLVEHTGDLIYVMDGDGNYKFVNQTIEREYEYTTSELLGKGFADIITPESYAVAVEVFKKQLKGIDVGSVEYDIYDKNGEIRTIETKERLIWETDRVIEVYGIARDVTDRKRVEAALRESEEKYRMVVENANEMIIISQGGVVKFINERVKDLFGISPKSMLGIHLLDLVIKEDRKRIQEDYRKRLSREDVLPLYRYRTRDRERNIRTIEISATEVTWEGQPSILSFVSDITEKVRAEDEIKRRLRYEQAVAFCSQQLVHSADLETSMQTIVTHLLNKLAVGGVFICKNVMDPVEGISMLTIAEAITDRHKPMFDGPIPRKVAYKYRSPEMLDALSNARRFGGPTKEYPPVDREILTILGSLSSITIPIFVADTFWGFVGFDDYETQRIWDEQDILILETISSIFGTAIAKNEAQLALAESEEKYRELVDSTNDMIYVADYKGNLQFVNNAVRQLGYEPEEIIGRNFYEFYAPSSMKYAQELFRLQRTGAQLRGYELDFIRKDGQIRTIEFRDDLKWEGDRIVEVRGIGRDVTERKKMEDRLRLVAGSQEAVLNSIPEMVFFADLALKISWANPAASRLTGFSIEELVGRFCYEVLHQKKAPCEGCPAVISLATGRFEENNSIPCSGKNRLVTVYPVPDISGNVTGIAVSIGGVRSRHFHDISESFSQLDDDIEQDNTSELFLAPLDPNYIYPFSLFIDVQKDDFSITLTWDEYSKEHPLKRLTRSESAVARFIYLAARMKTDGTGWVDKDTIRAGTMDTNLNKLRSLLEESNIPFLDRFSSRMLIRSNKEEKKKVRLALSASNIEISPGIKTFRSKKHRYIAAVSKKIKALERELEKSSQPREYLVSELTIQRRNETNLMKSIEVVETLIGESAALLKY